MAGTKSPYVHVGLLSWRTISGQKEPRLELIDTIQHVGAREVPFLSAEVRRYPERWDVYVVPDTWRRPGTGEPYHPTCGRKATNALRKRAQEKYPYGWKSFFAAARLHWPVLRWFPPGDLHEDEDELRVQMCSGTVSQDMREAGGFDPAPDLKDRYTVPADVVKRLEYLFSPVWIPRTAKNRNLLQDEAQHKRYAHETIPTTC